MAVFYAFCAFFCLKQKTADVMRISDWSSDVCSSDLQGVRGRASFFLGTGKGRAAGCAQCRAGLPPYPASGMVTRMGGNGMAGSVAPAIQPGPKGTLKPARQETGFTL